MEERFVERRNPLPERENLWKPKLKGVTGTKQGRRGCGWSNASRG
jgi:hypothetical protein